MPLRFAAPLIVLLALQGCRSESARPEAEVQYLQVYQLARPN